MSNVLMADFLIIPSLLELDSEAAQLSFLIWTLLYIGRLIQPIIYLDLSKK